MTDQPAGPQGSSSWLPAALLICGGVISLVAALFMVIAGRMIGLPILFAGLGVSSAGVTVLRRRPGRGPS